MRRDVLVRGAGFAGQVLAERLRRAGVDVAVLGASRPASAVAAGVVFPGWSEHPHRLEAGLGTAEAGALVTFLSDALAGLPGLARVGVDVRLSAREVGEGPEALAAAARIGLVAHPTADGYRLDGGLLTVPAFNEPRDESGEAEVEILASGWGVTDAAVADKILPVRWQSSIFEGPSVPRPIVTQHYSVSWSGALVATGARWATPHLEVGETEPVAEPRVTAMLERLTIAEFPSAEHRSTRVGIVGEGCDGLPLVGPLPGRPRVVACLGFGGFGLLAAWASANALADELLGLPGARVPRCLRVTRFV